ncbi:DUF115 domain-containing protein [Bdellovibrio sp. 22V]|uniref:6-hydroxymethylpterin diphosphokinase MptE-like protein n=1 Tax=Bdellovibrio sp. 22V TaxID=3044166 RepID=UPI00254340A5|nr:6-hydroxymethylpterin diphosphokinase MptE-like protein [Bdellovibrio sp. 22V]WII71832.1 DUF115 domain-containing protein [Bdellovibrio sp. 22V]
MNRQLIKQTLDSSILVLHNTVLDLLFWLSPARKIVQRNESYKNKHEGQSCIIFGNGPSLKSFDVSGTKGHFTFVVNYFFKSNAFPTLQPDYYALIDELFYEGEIAATKEAIKKYPQCTFLFKSKCLKSDFLRSFAMTSSKAIVTFNQKALVDSSVHYDMTKNFTASINVINHCIQCAIYMGFKRIYLVGCDFNSFTSNKMQHFYENKNDEKALSLGDELKFYAEVCYHHYALNKLARGIGIEIINATPNSLLDAYPKGRLPAN